jgi:predicted lipoprotein with Yx(FWY)xxD motif
MLVAAACGGDDSTDTTAEAPATPTTGEGTTDTTAGSTDTTSGDGATTTSGAEAMDGVHVAETDLGPILVNADGFTLYVFTPDTDGVSTCYDDCAASWPAVPGDTPIGSDLDAAMFGTAPRDDGSEQLTVNGMPLYLFAGDTAAGDTNGQGANDVWFVVDESGAMIEASADDAALVDYGY